MLFLVGAVVGVFASQDLLLFYVFFEAMLIPIYVLVGVWGGPNRVAATVTFVIYTMAGSLLMLASIVVFGLSQGTFSLIDSGTSGNDWVFLGFIDRVRSEGAAAPLPRLAAHRVHRGAARGGRPALRRRLQGRRVRPDLDRAAALPGPGGQLADGRARARRGRARLRLAARIPAAGRPRGRRVLVDGPDEPDRARHLRRGRPRRQRRHSPLGQPRTRLGGDVPARRDADPAHRHRPLRRARRACAADGRRSPRA